MRKLMRYSLIISIFILIQAGSNPLPLPLINEIRIDQSNFTIEIDAKYFGNRTFDGWYLTSQTDTVAIDSGIVLMDSNYQIIYEYIVLTQDSLMSNFKFNSEEDEIGLGFYRTRNDTILEFEAVESVCYGNSPNSVIGAPRTSQTICSSGAFWYYLDNSPTLGMINDTEGAFGHLDGFVIDSSGAFKSNYSFVYADYMYSSGYSNVTTNQDGYFIIESIARRIFLHLKESGRIGAYLMTQQIYPEDTMHVMVNIDNFTGIKDKNSKPVIQDFMLEQNYPNPFNNRTTFNYFLPLSDFIEISIYDISGKKVEVLVDGYSNSGSHKIIWEATSCASGIYFLNLSTSHGMFSRKCILIK